MFLYHPSTRSGVTSDETWLSSSIMLLEFMMRYVGIVGIVDGSVHCIVRTKELLMAPGNRGLQRQSSRSPSWKIRMRNNTYWPSWGVRFEVELHRADLGALRVRQYAVNPLFAKWLRHRRIKTVILGCLVPTANITDWTSRRLELDLFHK